MTASERFRRRLLEFLARLIYRHPWAVLAAGLLLAVGSLLATREWLGIKTSRDDLISPDEEYVRIYQAYEKETGDRDDVVIVLEDRERNLRRAKRFARDLGERLEGDPQAAREVFYRIDPDAFDGKALMFLEPEDLDDVRVRLVDYEDLIDTVAADPSLVTLLRAINREISAALVGHLVSSFLGTSEDEDDDDAPLDLSLLETLVDSIALAAEGEPYGSVWRKFLRPDDEMEEDGYLTDDSRHFVFVLVLAPEDPTRMDSAADAVERVRAHITALRPLYPEVDVGITGGPVLADEEMQQSVRDTSLASVIAVIGVGLCFVLFYRDVARPLLAVLTLLVGLAWAFGYITFSVGHLTVLSVAFATILIGMSDDFGVHLISRLEEELHGGRGVEEALRRTIVNSGGGIIAGAVTFAVAFFAMAFTPFLGMAELGVIGGGGVLLCLVAMLTIFPALLVLHERFKQTPAGGWIDAHLRLPQRLAAWEPRVIDRLYRRPAVLLALAGALTVVSLFGLPRVELDMNAFELQSEHAESVVWERKILAEGRSANYAASLADTLEEARRLEKAYDGLAVVGRVESAASVVPDRQVERIAAVEALAPVARRLPAVGAASDEVDVAEVRELLQTIRFKLRDPEWDPERKPAEDELERVRQALARVEPLLAGDPAVLEPRLLALQRDVILEFADQIDFLKKNLRPGTITVATLPPVLRDRFIGVTGKFLVQIFPNRDTWQPQAMEEFVESLRTVDPLVTGGPVSFLETSRRMRDGYIRAGVYALVAITLLVLWDFRSLRLTLFALVPLLVGGLWTVGLMWAFGLAFNLANLIILPLITGIGISNGIHIVHRHLEDGSREMSVIARSTGKAVVLSSLTTMVGFGALMVADHRGIFSLGLLLALGIGCNLLASLTILPALLALAAPAEVS